MKNEIKQGSRKFFLAGVTLLAIGAVGVMYMMQAKGYYASGNDAWGHLFKSDLMYQNFQEGQYYPLYSPLWYNGVQPYRYWAPFPYYLLAFLQRLAGGSIQGSYYFFAGFSFFAGGMAFLLWGKDTKRIGFTAFLACIWFFLPENIRVFFCEGNVPRLVTHFIIPYVVYFMWRFIEKKDSHAMIGIMVGMILMTLSHVMLAAMMGIGTFIFLFFYSFSKKDTYLRAFEILVGMLITFLICGIWLVPALSGGLVGMDGEASTSVMASLTYDLKTSLNPFNRISGVIDTFYYGISIVVISILGLLLAKQKEKAGYVTALIVLVLTTSSAVPILSKIPLSQLLWMMRFATIAYAFVFWSLISWHRMKKGMCILLMGILLIDCIPSFNWNRYYTQVAGKIDEELEIAKEITKQRVALLDLSGYGSYPSYVLGRGEDKINYTYGWAWQGASTAPNIVMLNTALETENYNYLFDRCLELGNDTVIVAKKQVGMRDKTEADLVQAALASGYMLYKETNEVYIFHQKTPHQFGVKTEYKGLGIGKYASNMELKFPLFTTGGSVYLDEYDYETLKSYEIIYLSGFSYHKKEEAEALVNQLADAGVKILVDMTHIPIDKRTKRMSFLGVTAEDVTFEESYSSLYYKDEQIIPSEFEQVNRSWHTKYLQDVLYIEGKTSYAGQELTFLGKNENKNIIFMGLNLVFHVLQTEDKEVLALLSDVIGMREGQLPERTLVPLNITYGNNEITIKKEVEGEVSTTLAYQDCFKADDSVDEKNHLLYVSERNTNIKMTYPYLKIGSMVTFLGCILGYLLMIFIRKINLD